MLPLFGTHAADAANFAETATQEDEERFNAIYLEKLKAREEKVAAMGFELDEQDRKDLEMMLRTQYCGFQAKLRCEGSPPAYGNNPGGGRSAGG